MGGCKVRVRAVNVEEDAAPIPRPERITRILIHLLHSNTITLAQIQSLYSCGKKQARHDINYLSMVLPIIESNPSPHPDRPGRGHKTVYTLDSTWQREYLTRCLKNCIDTKPRPVP